MSIAPLAIEFLDWKLIYLTIGHHGNTVASGDSRAKIVSEYNDTFAIVITLGISFTSYFLLVGPSKRRDRIL